MVNEDIYLAGGNRERIENYVFERIVRGDNVEDIMRELRTRLNFTTAYSIIEKAQMKIVDLRESGEYEKAEYEVIFSPKSTTGNKNTKYGIIMILFVIIGTGASYVMAAPGQSYSVLFGLIFYGIYQLSRDAG